MAQKIDRQDLQILFLEAIARSDFRFIEGLNPFHILLNGKKYWIYIKNLTSAHFTNPDVWRAQLPSRDNFNIIKESGTEFIMLGYDTENDVYATWNPAWIKQRLNSTENVSLYSRYSLQVEARQSFQLKRMDLGNGGEVIVFPREMTNMFFINVGSYFLNSGDYVAMGSKRRPEANEAFKTFSKASNINHFAKHLIDSGLSSITTDSYCKIIKTLIAENFISRNKRVFLQYDSISDYEKAISNFIDIPEVRAKNTHCNNLISSALKSYISFLNNNIHSKETESTVEMPIKELHDWETEFTDPNGKLTKISNPELLERLRPVLNQEYKNTATAYNIVEDFYGDRFKEMELFEWGRLFKQIDWSKHAVTITPSVSKLCNGKLKVSFPNGRTIKPNKALDALIEVVIYAGVERVHALNIICCGTNLILKNPPPRYKNSCKPIGNNWFCNTCSNTKTKYKQIKTISDSLHLGLIIEIA